MTPLTGARARLRLCVHVGTASPVRSMQQRRCTPPPVQTGESSFDVAESIFALQRDFFDQASNNGR